MRNVAGAVVGMVLLALGAQGGIRLLVDHDNGGLLHWMPGGFAVWLCGYVVISLAGALLAGWGSRKVRAPGSGR